MNSNIVQWRSLKTRMTLFTLIIFLFSLWSLSLFAGHILRMDMERLLGEQQFSTASIVAEQIDGELINRRMGLEAVAAQVSPATMANPASLQTLLEQRPFLQLLFSGGADFVDLDGVVIADVPLTSGRMGRNYMADEWISAALKEGKSMISPPLMGPALRAPVFVMTVPIRDPQRKVIGALNGVINLGKPNFLDRITQGRYGKTGGYVLVAPQQRLVVTATDKSRIMQPLSSTGVTPQTDRFLEGFEGYAVYVNQRGEEVLNSSKRIPVAGWNLVVTMPTADAFAPIRTMQQHMLLITLLLTLLAGALTWWMVRRQLVPMLTTAKRLTSRLESDQNLQPLPITSQDEIGDLIGGFNRLLEILGHQRQALQESEERWKFALESSGDGVWDWNIQVGEVNYSRRWKEMLGYADREIGNSFDEWKRLVHPDDLVGALATIQEYFREEISEYVAECRLLCKDASWKWVLSRGKIVSRTSDGKPLRMIGTHVDITERKDAELQIAFVAHHDRLTGLANRSLFFDRFSQAISRARRSNKRVALLFVDLDGFKPVNDTYGHESGDIVLKVVAERMLSSVRAMDTVARMGGDEFVVILGELDSSTEVEPVAIKLLETLVQKISLPGRSECNISACIGISIFPDNGTEMDTLLAAADTAMYQSKHRGKGQYTFFLNAESPEATVCDWIRFDERHVVGIDEVDEQHEHLIALLNYLNKAIRGNEDRDSIANHLNKLTEYTKFHFDTEHDLMERYNYPDKRDHEIAHGRLLADALHFKTRMNRGGDLLVLQSIKDWLLNHIPMEDKPLAEFLKGQLPPGGRSLV